MQNHLSNSQRSISTDKTLSSNFSQPKTISRFSEDLNNRLKPLINTSLLTGMKTLTNTFSIRPPDSLAPFTNLIDKLEEITEKKTTFHIEHPLKDLDPYHFKLNKKENVLFQVETLSRVCPLIVSIKKTGKILTFVSSKHQIPDQYSYEKVFSSSKFFVSDKNYRFKVKTLFFSVFALENVEITIEVEFKKKEEGSISERRLRTRQETERKLETIRNSVELRQEFTNRVEKILENRRKEALEKAGYKNFVKNNKSYQTAEERKDVIRSKSEEKLQKEKSVSERKEFNYKLKIEKAKSVVNKQEIRKKQREEIELLRKKQEHHNAIAKIWLKLVCFTRSLSSLDQKFKSLKQIKTKSFTSALKIQKNYRRWNTQLFESVSKELLHTRNILLFYSSHTQPHLKSFKHLFLQSINHSVSIQKPRIAFESFFTKIITIQSYIREYLAIREQIMNKSVKMWMVQSSSIIRKLLGSNPDNKFLNQVIRIKDSRRYTVLKEFLREKCYYRKITWKNLRRFLPTKAELYRLIKLASVD